jgi:hypothetical protein
MAKIPNRKQEIVGLLHLLASEDQQLAYAQNVQDADVSAELLCMWFDDEYHPKDALFRSCFTADELAALAEFHRFYEERSKQLPASQGTIRTWLANPAWREVMKKAHETVSRIAV